MARNDLGRWVPGTSGNPGGRPKPPDGLRSRLAELSPRAVECLAGLLDSGDERVRLEAAKAIRSTKHTYGQSTRTLTLNASKEQHHDRLDSHRCEREIASAGKKKLLPEYSAAVIGSSVVLRLFAGGFTSLSFALTTVPFATPDDARAWVEANRTDMAYESQLPNGS